MFFKRRSYTGKHVCITGGSEGLGYALASLFIREQGTRVTLISRTQSKLQHAKDLLDTIIKEESLTSSIHFFIADVRQYDSIHSAITQARKEVGEIDVLICNAGKALSGRFLDSKVESFADQMELNYLGAVYSVKSVVEGMVQTQRGEIVLISSALGVLGMTGYSCYAPTKWALRGFADCLRMEMQTHRVKVRIAYPPDMDTPGYQTELQHTPVEVLDIMKAAGDTVFKPIEVARVIIKGMKQDLYHLPSPDFLQTLSQAGMTGLSPASFCLPFQSLVCGLCVFVYAYFVWTFDKITRHHASKRTQ